MNSLWHGDHREDHQWHQHGDQSKWTEAGDSHKPQVPGLSFIQQWFKAWYIVQDSADDTSTDKVETSLERQEHFSQFQDTTDALPCHIHLPVCLRTLTAELQIWIWAIEMRCYRKILHILDEDHVTNKEVCAKIQHAVGPHEDLLPS